MGCLQLCAFLAFCIALAGAACELKCYVCDDCDILDDSLLKSCPPLVTTSAPPTGTTETTPTPYTSSSDIHTTSSTRTTPTARPPTTQDATATATSETITEEHTTEGPATSIEPTTEEPTTEEPTTEEPATEEPTTEEPTTEEDITEEPTSEVPTTDISQSTTDEATETITNETLATSSEGNPSEAPSYPPTPAKTEASETILTTEIFVPSAQPMGTQKIKELLFPASTLKTELDTSNGVYSQPLSYRLQYYCYSMEITVQHKRVKKRGCVDVDEYEDPCTVLEQDEANGSSVRNCKVCSQDRCNSTSTLESSMSVLVIAASLLFVIRI